MAEFLDVLLRGAILALGSLVLGGVAWTRLVLRTEPHAKPSAPTVLAPRIVEASATLTALAQLATLVVALGELGAAAGRWPLTELARTTFAHAVLGRAVLSAVVSGLAVGLAGRATGPGAC